MRTVKKEGGFTLLEILIAVAIMALGFLALAEMQYLALRQKQKAELGTVATNMIQFVADVDLAEVRRLHLLNTITHSAAVAGRPLDLSYCNGTEPDTGCTGCPCDVMEVLTSVSYPNPPEPPAVNEDETCAPIETHDFDPEKLVFSTNVNDCADPDADMYIIKNVRLSQQQDPETLVDVLTATITYAVKTPGQFRETGLTIIDDANNRPILRNSVATQTQTITAHVDDWSAIIPGWAEIRIAHVE